MPFDEMKFLDGFREAAHASGAELYFQRPTAIEIVECCMAAEVAVIGLEGFLRQNGGLVPQLHQIADFSDVVGEGSSWAEAVQTCGLAAKRFLESATDSTLWFCLVLVDASVRARTVLPSP